MSMRTEANLLHDSGAAYRRRVGLIDGQGGLIFAGIKPGVFSLYLGEEPHYHFDLEGRWQRICLDGVHYLKALDGSASALERVREGQAMVMRRRPVRYTELSDLDETARQVAVDLLEKLGDKSLTLSNPPEPALPLKMAELVDLLDRVCRNDAAAWFRNREIFLRIYGSKPDWFLPPSCPQPIVLSVSRTGAAPGGWVWDSGQESVMLSDEELEKHCVAISKFLGRRATQARGIVLADGEVLRGEASRILGWLKTIARVFPLEATGLPRKLSDRPVDEPFLDGIYSFLNGPGGQLPDTQGWQALQAAHLRRVEVGVVSGDPQVRLRHGLGWADADLEQLIANLKQAGIAAGLVVPVGAGGTEYASQHVELTCRLLNALPLAAGDLVYLVDLNEIAGADAASMLEERGLTPLPEAAQEAQKQALREALAPLKERKVKVVPYTIEKQ